MAKKQKAEDKTVLNDESIDTEDNLEEDESIEKDVDSLDQEADENQNADEKIKDLEEALLRSRAELDNAFKRNTADIEKAISAILRFSVPEIAALSWDDFSSQSLPTHPRNGVRRPKRVYNARFHTAH